jgi:serine/threonine-protein kinase
LTEEGRAFFQDRLRLFGGWIFLISSGFYAVGMALRASYDVEFNTATLFHLIGTVIAGGIWAAGRSVRLSMSVAQGLDAAGTVLLCVSYAFMGGAIALSDRVVIAPMHALFSGLLACSYVLISRAVAMPSTPGRTSWISAVAMVPTLATTAYVFNELGAAGLTMPSGYFVDVASWAVAAVTMAAVASRVIFGLRAEVSKIRQLGQYTLEERIGAGGMGVVYRARHAMLRRPTAIKLLPPEKAGEENLHRFEREVQLTARLSHPSTVAVFDFGRTPDGVFYYAMEYLDGVDLERLVREDGPQPAGRVAHILEQVSGALAEAHGMVS